MLSLLAFAVCRQKDEHQHVSTPARPPLAAHNHDGEALLRRGQLLANRLHLGLLEPHGP
jgi:hypothetical protein